MNEIAQPERETQKPVRRNPSIGDSRMRRMLAFDHSAYYLTAIAPACPLRRRITLPW